MAAMHNTHWRVVSPWFGNIELIPTAETCNFVQRVTENVVMHRTVRNDPAPILTIPWYRYPRSFNPTPPATLPFHTLGNVMMTPHVSNWTEGMLTARLVADNIGWAARGEPAPNAIELAP